METKLKQKLLTQFFLTQMELEKMEFNFQSKSTNGKTSISERPENINFIGNEELDLIIKNDGLVNIYNLRGNQRSSTFRKIVQSNFDINMPNKTGGVEINDGKHFLQVSPDEWILSLIHISEPTRPY